MKKNLLKRQSGSVTLFLVIIIPLLLISMLLVYDLIDVKADESKALKVAVACSEVRLSRYNEFLFKRYGLLAYLEDGSLNEMINTYYENNNLQAKREPDMKVEVSSMALNDPIHYLSAVRSAAPYVISDSVIDEVMHFLEQNENVLKAQSFINDKIERYNELSKKFERSEVHKSLEELIDFKDSLELDQALTVYRNYVDYGTEAFYSACFDNQRIDQKVKMESADIQMYYENVWHQDQVDQLIQKYNDQTNQLYICYVKLLRQKSNLEIAEMRIKNMDYQINSYQESLSRLYEMNPLPMAAIQTFQNQINVKELEKENFKIELEKAKSNIKETSQTMLKSLSKQDSGLFDKFNQLKDKMNQLAFSSYSIEEKALTLNPEYEYSANSAYTQNSKLKEAVKTIGLPEKIMINEYLISISKTIVEHDVRHFDPLNIKDSEHAKIQGEVEYLIGHSSSDVENFNEVKREIILTRTGLNLIGIVLNGEKRTQLTELVAPIPFPWNAATYAVVLSVWSGIEGYYDWTVLRDGEGVHLIKKDEEWLFDLNTLIASENILEDIQNGKANPNTEEEDKASEDLVNHLDRALYYRDYLRIFMSMQGLDRTILRHMELVEAQIQLDSKDKNKLENFKIGHEINIEGHFPYIFRSDLSTFSLNFSNAYDLHFKR
ncbi:DUF5702 domain-containing protein [Fusibacter ferrireducens]|uniref:Flp pilus-assembly TadE/G-like n=1 Tax=Fusibacter ferrireducens TaxID=2785058 RepID=A0ABR9ZY36_9FIRM|nr:DUF5702 domain-containing protein [Fusibacter ferrireducens]MBF4695383.1 hypothetical protein [Fusibacter ferrireducens]